MKKIVKLLNVLPNLARAKERDKTKIRYLDNLFKLTSKQKILGKNKSFFIRTYGCQANERDGEIISAILLSMGFVQSND